MTTSVVSVTPSESPSPRPTLAERENLLTPTNPSKAGFKPRAIEKLAIKRLPRSMTNIECAHFLRSSGQESATGNKSLQYLLWMEAGKHEPPIPQRPDTQYNANVWRNFRKSYGFYVNSDGQKVSEMIANMYPMNIPPPSRVGDYTYSKFLKETPLIQDQKRRQFAIDRTAKDIIDFKQMKLRSDLRNPPLDTSGKIVPPVNFKHYVHRFIPPPGYSDHNPLPPPLPPTGETRIDMFGQEVPRAEGSNPHLWKLTYKLNHPQYQKVKDEMERRKNMSYNNSPYVSLGHAY